MNLTFVADLSLFAESLKIISLTMKYCLTRLLKNCLVVLVRSLFGMISIKSSRVLCSKVFPGDVGNDDTFVKLLL
jgi:hypothetical protein